MSARDDLAESTTPADRPVLASAPDAVDAVRPLPIPGLTGLRIIGAVWVLLFHFQPTLYEAWPALTVLKPLLAIGDLGVPLFFLLSGYIIWHNYGFRSLLTPRSTVRFIWRRFARLWPVNLLSQLLAIPVIAWGVVTQGYWGFPIPPWYSVGGWFGSAFMVGQLTESDVTFAWNQPSWSLAGEMAEYLFFPILLAALLVTVVRARPAVIWFVVAIGLACAVKLFPEAFPYRWLVDLTVYFVIGTLLRISGIPRGVMAVVASVAQIAAPVGIAVFAYVDYRWVVPCLAVWVWSLAAPSGPGVWVFSRRPFEIAGLSSYSVYMLHWLIFGASYIVAAYIPIHGWHLWVFIVVDLLAVAVASYLVWRFFETPCRQLLNRLFERVWRRPAARAGAVAADAGASSSPGHDGQSLPVDERIPETPITRS